MPPPPLPKGRRGPKGDRILTPQHHLPADIERTSLAIITAELAELGLAFVPEPMAQEPLARGEIVRLHLQEIIPLRSVCLVYDPHRPLNTAARRFQQLLTDDAPKEKHAL